MIIGLTSRGNYLFLNIRLRETTGFSAFELMHSSRKPRLPTEAENLTMLYPDVAVGTHKPCWMLPVKTIQQNWLS